MKGSRYYTEETEVHVLMHIRNACTRLVLRVLAYLLLPRLFLYDGLWWRCGSTSSSSPSADLLLLRARRTLGLARPSGFGRSATARSPPPTASSTSRHFFFFWPRGMIETRAGGAV